MPPTWFVDESLGHGVVEALRANDATVVAHRDVYPPGVDDAVWLVAAAQQGWLQLTKDQRIAYTPLYTAAIRRTGAQVFALVGGNLRGAQMAEAFVRALPNMEALAFRTSGPFIAKVYRDGRVAMWRKGQDL